MFILRVDSGTHNEIHPINLACRVILFDVAVINLYNIANVYYQSTLTILHSLKYMIIALLCYKVCRSYSELSEISLIHVIGP